MSPDQSFPALDALQAQLRGALDQQLAALQQQYEEALTETRRNAIADAERATVARLAQARTEWESQLEAVVAAARAEAEQRAAESAATQREALEREFHQKLAQHTESAAAQKAELERQMQQQLAQHAESAAAQKAELEQQMQQQLAQHTASAETQRNELEQQLQQKLAQHTESAEAQRTDLAQQLQQEMDRQIEQHVSVARRTAQLELESERRRALNELEAERQRSTTEFEALKDRAQADVAKARAAAAATAAAVPRATTPGMPGAPAATSLARVPLAIQDLDATRTLSQALESLVTHAGAIAGRAALFLINGNRLKAWKASGIPDIDVQTVESSIGAKDQLARAIQAGEPLASSASLPAPPFARLSADRVGLAAPVMIGGRAVAVLYADNGAALAPSPAGWQEAIDLVVRHAAAVVALRTAMRTLDVLNGVDAKPEGASAADPVDDGVQGARRYARLLVSEIKLYNEAAVRDGRQQRDLLHRLRAEIERAQRLYEERIPPAVASRQQYFQQELVQTLADGDAALLGNA